MKKLFLKNIPLSYLLATGLFITACNKTLPLRVEKPNDNLIFVLPDKNKYQTIAIQDFTVIRNDCTQDCTMWALANTIDAQGELTFAILKDSKINYGELQPGIEVVTPAHDLTSGNYSAGGTAVFLNDKGAPVGGRIMNVDFTIEGAAKTLRLE